MDFGICQTSTASPAEPGGFPLTLARHARPFCITRPLRHNGTPYLFGSKALRRRSEFLTTHALTQSPREVNRAQSLSGVALHRPRVDRPLR